VPEVRVQIWDAAKMHNIRAVALRSVSFALSGIYVHIKSEATTGIAPKSTSAESFPHEPRARGTATLDYLHFRFPILTASLTPLSLYRL
jgi:hypothetical protein